MRQGNVPFLRGLAACLAVGAIVFATAEADERNDARDALVDAVAGQIERWKDEPPNPAVIEALRTVPRHQFVPAGQRPYAYQNRPLPIGHGQTISQPFIVGLMTELLEPKEGMRVLEIGTGSAYQAAVLAATGAQVYSIEIIEPLGVQARERLDRLGYDDVQTRVGDGYYGWPEAAPFDGIIVTAAADHVPPPLIEQLRSGGRMVIPVGPAFSTQQLMLIEKTDGGDVNMQQLLPVRFVPLTGER